MSDSILSGDCANEVQVSKKVAKREMTLHFKDRDEAKLVMGPHLT